MAAASVTAGFRCASGLPHATAVTTPTKTAKAHPAVITIHPAFAAFESFSSTPPTTPSPNNTNTAVPMNSPKTGEAIRLPQVKNVSAQLLDPVKRTRYRLLPLTIQPSAFALFHPRVPGAIDLPVLGEVFDPGVVPACQSRSVRRTQRSRLPHRRPDHGAVQNICLELHQELIGHHTPVRPQLRERNTGVGLHRLQDISRLKGSRFEHGSCDMS